ncbi:MAG: hypothetical protein HZB38_18510 [Planctomycetes bacterium]|nr:hypothetical protein [Planctomycetota bacterium]
MRRRVFRTLVTGVGLSVCGGVFQLGCSPTAGLLNMVRGINPCGTIFNCDPREYQFITSGIDGPGVNPEKDPFCSFPPFCSAAEDPIFGDLGGNP